MAFVVTSTAPDTASHNRSATRTALLFGTIAAVVSAAGSWIPSLWADEVTSVMSAARSFPSLIDALQHVDAVHGLYYVGLHLWGSVFGLSPFSVRLPSAVAVGLMTAAVVLIADRLRSRQAAVIAGTVCAILPRVTYMGEEARSYAFSAAIATWLTLILIAALTHHRGSKRLWIAYGALLAIGMYTFLYLGLFIIVHAIFIAVVRPRRGSIPAWATATGAALVVASPVIVYGLLEHGQIAYLGNVDQLAPDTLFSSLWFGHWTFAVFGWALIGVAVGFETARIRQRKRDGHRVLTGWGPSSLAILSLLWLFVPVLILIAIHGMIPDFTARYVSFCAPAAALLISSGVDDLFRFRRWVGVVAAATGILLVLPVYLSQRTPYAKNDSDLAQIAADVGANAREGDAVVFDESPRPSHRPRLALHAYPAGFSKVRDVTLQSPYTDTRTLRDKVFTVSAAAALGRFADIRRVWVIEYASSPTHADSYGVAALEAICFQPAATRIQTHRGLITLYVRTP